MKTLYILIPLLLGGMSLNSQDIEESVDSSRYNCIKIHKNFRFESMPHLIFNGTDFNYFIQRQNFFAPGFGISYTRELKNGDFLEIGLAELMINNSTSTETWVEGDSLLYGKVRDVDYERMDIIGEINYAWKIGEGPDKGWRFLGGASIMPFIQSFDVLPVSDGFPVTINVVGATFSAYPALQLKIFNNGWLDLRMPFQLMRIAGIGGDDESAFLNLFEEQQRKSDFELLPSIYEFRAGIGFSF